MRVRAMTLVETLAATILGSVVVGSATLTFSLLTRRSGIDGAEAAVISQASSLASDLSMTLRNAASATVVTVPATGLTALRVDMPSTGTDRDGDSIIDSATPSSVSAVGAEVFAVGKSVWFYFSDSSGVYGASGSVLWRAVTAATATPSASGIDTVWALPGGRTRWNLIESVIFVNNAASGSTTFTISASSLTRASRPAGNATGSDGVRITLTREIAWRNAR